jgi:hypothetical protein
MSPPGSKPLKGLSLPVNIDKDKLKILDMSGHHPQSLDAQNFYPRADKPISFMSRSSDIFFPYQGQGQHQNFEASQTGSMFFARNTYASSKNVNYGVSGKSIHQEFVQSEMRRSGQSWNGNPVDRARSNVTITPKVKKRKNNRIFINGRDTIEVDPDLSHKFVPKVIPPETTRAHKTSRNFYFDKDLQSGSHLDAASFRKGGLLMNKRKLMQDQKIETSDGSGCNLNDSRMFQTTRYGNQTTTNLQHVKNNTRVGAMPPEIERMITDTHQNQQRMNILNTKVFDLSSGGMRISNTQR